MVLEGPPARDARRRRARAHARRHREHPGRHRARLPRRRPLHEGAHDERAGRAREADRDRRRRRPRSTSSAPRRRASTSTRCARPPRAWTSPLPDEANGLGTEAVYQRVREAILEGEIAPGSTMSQVALADELGISRTPLREALRMLQSEGLVDAERNRRVRVAPVSAARPRGALRHAGHARGRGDPARRPADDGRGPRAPGGLDRRDGALRAGAGLPPLDRPAPGVPPRAHRTRGRALHRGRSPSCSTTPSATGACTSATGRAPGRPRTTAGSSTRARRATASSRAACSRSTSRGPRSS